MRSYCLYNDNYIDIAEIYEIWDGKQINIPEKLKYYRKLSNNRELFCPCGCGEVVILVAGDRNLKRQHFRLLHNFENSGCDYQEESEISVKSKIMLKCWLTNKLPVMEHGIKYRVPISKLIENKRRYELSMYSEDYDIGVIYNKYVSGILEEKVELLSDYMKSKIIYVTRIENEETGGQYPEHMMRIQESQGFCFYLNMTADMLYEDVKAKVSIYEKTYNGLWQIINVCNGKLDEFDLRMDGAILYKGELIPDLVDKKRRIFHEEQANELEQILKREEANRLEQERIQKKLEEIAKIEEERIRIEEEKRKQKELEEQKAREEKQRREEEELKNFAIKYTKFERVYNLLKNIKSIKGTFSCDKKNGKSSGLDVEIEIAKLIRHREQHCIEILNHKQKRAYIYVLEKGFSKIVVRPRIGEPYKVMDYTRISDVEHHFKIAVNCVFKGSDNEVKCSAPEINCQFLRDNDLCVCENSCPYKKIQ